MRLEWVRREVSALEMVGGVLALGWYLGLRLERGRWDRVMRLF